MSKITDQLSYIAAMAPPADANVATPQRTRWMWAVVTQANPLRIRLEPDSQALDLTPDTLVGGLRVNDRVQVVLIEKDLLVVGRTNADTGWLDCTILPGFAARGPEYKPQVRKTNDGMVHFRGHMANTGFSGTSPMQFATVPAGSVPAVEVRFVAYQTNRSYILGGWIAINTGLITLQMPDGPPSTHFALITQPWQAAS